MSAHLLPIYRRYFLGNKMIPDIINHHFTRYWESDDLWVSYPWSTGCTSGDPTVYFVLVSLFKIIYIFSRVWFVGTYPINDQTFLEWDFQKIPSFLPKMGKIFGLQESAIIGWKNFLVIATKLKKYWQRAKSSRNWNLTSLRPYKQAFLKRRL